jgi:hypothetical protein
LEEPEGFDVKYESPTEGTVHFGTTGPLVVNGAEIPLDAGHRYDNPWVRAEVGARQLTIADEAGAASLDFAASTRIASGRSEPD